jgi:hypothetical protein
MVSAECLQSVSLSGEHREASGRRLLTGLECHQSPHPGDSTTFGCHRDIITHPQAQSNILNAKTDSIDFGQEEKDLFAPLAFDETITFIWKIICNFSHWISQLHVPESFDKK